MYNPLSKWQASHASSNISFIKTKYSFLWKFSYYQLVWKIINGNFFNKQYIFIGNAFEWKIILNVERIIRSQRMWNTATDATVWPLVESTVSQLWDLACTEDKKYMKACRCTWYGLHSRKSVPGKYTSHGFTLRNIWLEAGQMPSIGGSWQVMPVGLI